MLDLCKLGREYERRKNQVPAPACELASLRVARKSDWFRHAAGHSLSPTRSLVAPNKSHKAIVE
jgi:hypothetical protein